MNFLRASVKGTIAVLVVAVLGAAGIAGQQLDSAAMIQRVDAAVKARIDHVAAYTVTEHYAVFRGSDETHPAAEMMVKTDYRRESGKNYTILSESGSGFLLTHVLHKILEDEKQINMPGTREHLWLTSANYAMQVKPGMQTVDGRECVAVAVTPLRKAADMIEGTLWVDVKDGTLVRLEGNATQSPSIFTGPAQLMREYVNVNGFSMATHAKAVSQSFLLGQTVIKIDYQDYTITSDAGH
jgi:hypothetical protein